MLDSETTNGVKMTVSDNGPVTLYFVYKEVTNFTTQVDHSKILAGVLTELEEAQRFAEILNGELGTTSRGDVQESSCVIADGKAYYVPQMVYVPNFISGFCKLTKEHRAVDTELITNSAEQALALFVDQLERNSNVPYLRGEARRTSQYQGQTIYFDDATSPDQFELSADALTLARSFQALN